MTTEAEKATREAIKIQERARRAAWSAGDTKGAKALTDKIERNKQKLS